MGESKSSAALSEWHPMWEEVISPSMRNCEVGRHLRQNAWLYFSCLDVHQTGRGWSHFRGYLTALAVSAANVDIGQDSNMFGDNHQMFLKQLHNPVAHILN